MDQEPLNPGDRRDPRVVRLREQDGQWYASLAYRAPLDAWAPRSVLGSYATRDLAIQAARDMAAMADVPRVCTWRDVEKVRKELREAKA